MASESRGIFFLDAPSASVCLLIQLEKPATEEGGATPSVYSRKEPVSQLKLERTALVFQVTKFKFQEIETRSNLFLYTYLNTLFMLLILPPCKYLSAPLMF